MKIDIGNYEIDILRLGGALALILLVIGIPLWYFVLRTPPSIDAKTNTKSPYSQESKIFSYPFRDDAMQAEFEKNALVFNSGLEVSQNHPLVTGQFPSGFGQPAKMYVWFPDGNLDAASDQSFTNNGYRYYRGIVVPGNDAAAFRRVQETYGEAAQASQSDPFDAEGLEPVVLGFQEGTEPPAGTEFISTLALYYWTSNYMNPANVPIGYSAFLVGSYETVEQSAIADPPTAIIPSDIVMRSGALTVTLERFEIGATGTRALVTVSNDSSSEVDWDWRSGAFALADSVSYKPTGDDVADPATQPPDQLPITFPPAVTRGYMMFPRFTLPQSILRLNVPLPTERNDDTQRWEVAWDLRRVEKPNVSEQAPANVASQTPANTLSLT